MFLEGLLVVELGDHPSRRRRRLLGVVRAADDYRYLFYASSTELTAFDGRGDARSGSPVRVPSQACQGTRGSRTLTSSPRWESTRTQQ